MGARQKTLILELGCLLCQAACRVRLPAAGEPAWHRPGDGQLRLRPPATVPRVGCCCACLAVKEEHEAASGSRQPQGAAERAQFCTHAQGAEPPAPGRSRGCRAAPLASWEQLTGARPPSGSAAAVSRPRANRRPAGQRAAGADPDTTRRMPRPTACMKGMREALSGPPCKLRMIPHAAGAQASMWTLCALPIGGRLTGGRCRLAGQAALYGFATAQGTPPACWTACGEPRAGGSRVPAGHVVILGLAAGRDAEAHAPGAL